MRFVVDVMLGRLAKWLRIMGYDTLYSNVYRDEELARIADIEGRYLLTRDRELLSKYKVRYAILVTSDDVFDQLQELKEKLDVSMGESVLSRCVSCNCKIKEVSKDEVADEVPEYVHDTAPGFYRCCGCSKVYWSGTHVIEMKNRLKQIFDESE
jgi:uncharacterized protein with PIN domain